MDDDEQYPDAESAALMLRYLIRSWGLPANEESREYHIHWGLQALSLLLAPQDVRERAA